MIEEWPISKVLQTVTYSIDVGPLKYDCQWVYLLRYKSTDDEAFYATLEALESEGQLDPICVFFNTEYGWWELGNGHHRLIAALLLGWDTILVDTSDNFSERSDWHYEDHLNIKHTYEDNNPECEFNLWLKSHLPLMESMSDYSTYLQDLLQLELDIT